MSYEEARSVVLTSLSEREKLEGLAEEANELAHAALKLIRASGGNNWTPATRHEAYDKLKEELLDLVSYLDVLNIEIPESHKNKKWERWANRIQMRDK